MMLAAFSNIETVHIAAYAFLLETIGMPDTEFSAFMKYKEMADKHDYMQNLMLTLTMKSQRLLQCLEVSLKASVICKFCYALNFPRHNKMRGMGQIITWSVRDESLHCEGIVKAFS